MINQTTIKCPNCGCEIDINDALYHQLEGKYKGEYLAQKKQLEAELEAKRKEQETYFESLRTKEQQLQDRKEKFEEEIKKSYANTAKNGKSKTSRGAAKRDT